MKECSICGKKSRRTITVDFKLYNDSKNVELVVPIVCCQQCFTKPDLFRRIDEIIDKECEKWTKKNS